MFLTGEVIEAETVAKARRLWKRDEQDSGYLWLSDGNMPDMSASVYHSHEGED